MSRIGPSRDGGVWVKSEMCTTCIFRPGNLMRLDPGRVAGMKRRADESGTCIVCHEDSGRLSAAVCRGYYNNHESNLLEIAERMGVIKEQKI